MNEQNGSETTNNAAPGAETEQPTLVLLRDEADALAQPQGDKHETRNDAESSDDDRKSIGLNELVARHGEDWRETIGKSAAESTNCLFFDSRDKEVRQEFLTLGNDPEVISFLSDLRRRLGDDLFNGKSDPVDLDGMSDEQKLSLANDFASWALFESRSNPALVERLLEVAQNIDDKARIEWAARIGKRLFMAPDGNGRQGGDEVIFDKNAESEMDLITSGKHRLSEAWRRGDKGAREYFENLAKKATGEK